VAAGRFEEARPHAREAVEALSHQAHLHAWEGALLKHLGEDRAAVEAVERAVALDPQVQYRRLLEAYRGGAEADDLSQRRAARWASRVLARIRPVMRGIRKA